MFPEALIGTCTLIPFGAGAFSAIGGTNPARGLFITVGIFLTSLLSVLFPGAGEAGLLISRKLTRLGPWPTGGGRGGRVSS